MNIGPGQCCDGQSCIIAEDRAKKHRRAPLCLGAGMASSIESHGGGVFDLSNSI